MALLTDRTRRGEERCSLLRHYQPRSRRERRAGEARL
jgi:hypothetical protein